MKTNVRCMALLFAFIFALGCADGMATDDAVMPYAEGTPDSNPTEIGVLPATKDDTVAVAPGLYESGVPTELFEVTAQPGEWGRQRMSQWCWAATSQMILNFHNMPITQEEIVLNAYGGYIDRPAAGAVEIAQFVHGLTKNGIVAVAQHYDANVPLSVSEVIADLHANHPMIIALSNEEGGGGHAYVLSSMTYAVDVQGFVYPQFVELRDPWPDNPAHISISWADVQRRYLGVVRIDTVPAQ